MTSTLAYYIVALYTTIKSFTIQANTGTVRLTKEHGEILRVVKKLLKVTFTM
jgi:hypothetical protein